MKAKTCKICKVRFEPRNSLQVVCNLECAIELNLRNKDKKAKETAKIERKTLREAKVRAKTRGQWLKEAQLAFNAFIRARDIREPCISCGRPSTWNGQWHASHFYATSIRPNLRFNEDNVHKACSVCNNYMHGNLTPYRVRLIEKIGIENMNILDGAIEPAKYTIQDLKDVKAKYAKLTKELKSKMQD